MLKMHVWPLMHSDTPTPVRQWTPGPTQARLRPDSPDTSDTSARPQVSSHLDSGHPHLVTLTDIPFPSKDAYEQETLEQKTLRAKDAQSKRRSSNTPDTPTLRHYRP